jgi:hypothetical protein
MQQQNNSPPNVPKKHPTKTPGSLPPVITKIVQITTVKIHNARIENITYL